MPSPLHGCLFKSMLTGRGGASWASFQSGLYQMSYCWDVRDVVDIREIGKGWCCCGSHLLDLLFHDNRSHIEGGVSFTGWKSPSPIPETFKVGQAGQSWQQSAPAAAAVPVLYSVVFCTHRLKNDTTKNETGKEWGGRRKSQPLCATSLYIKLRLHAAHKRFEILWFWFLLFSKETPCCCQTTVLFP